MNLLKVAIFGATGYVGLELVKILSKHKRVKIIYLCASSSVGKSINLFDKKIKKKLPRISHINKVDFNNVDVIFTALPNGQAQIIAKKINKFTKLIDLSGDFRLRKFSEYKKWYRQEHKNKKMIHDSIYSISEFKREQMKNYQIISCPGCYPTSIQLPLVPLIEKKIIKTDNIIIDSKSGFSGAGKKIYKKVPNKILFNSVKAYGVGFHKHMPEVDQELSLYAKKKIVVSFTPHLIPMFRGILTTIYLDLKRNISPKKVYTTLQNYHKNNFFVKIGKFNKEFSTNDVMDTNFCKISVYPNRKKNKIIIVSAIDNLLKGASGQAVQNMNIIYGINEKESLI